LEQLGLIGLSKAIDRFNPENGAAFSSFAVPYIRGEMLHFLRDHGWSHLKVPRRAVETYSTVRRVHRLMLENGQELTEESVAKKLGIPEDKWRWVSEALDRKPLMQLDEISSIVADQTEEEDDSQWVTKALARLRNPYRYCLVERYFKGCSEAEIARQHDVSEDEVKVWVQQGLDKLRAIAEATNGN
jgi:RNA polymerase sigma-B factor